MGNYNLSNIPKDCWEIVTPFLDWNGCRKLIIGSAISKVGVDQGLISIIFNTRTHLDFLNCEKEFKFSKLHCITNEESRYNILSLCPNFTDLTIELEGMTCISENWKDRHNLTNLPKEFIEFLNLKKYSYEFKNAECIDFISSKTNLKNLTIKVPHEKYTELYAPLTLKCSVRESNGKKTFSMRDYRQYQLYAGDYFPIDQLMDLIVKVEKNNPNIEKIDCVLDLDNSEKLAHFAINQRIIWIRKKNNETFRELQERTSKMKEIITINKENKGCFLIFESEVYTKNIKALTYTSDFTSRFDRTNAIFEGYLPEKGIIHHNSYLRTCLHANGILIVIARDPFKFFVE